MSAYYSIYVEPSDGRMYPVPMGGMIKGKHGEIRIDGGSIKCSIYYAILAEVPEELKKLLKYQKVGDCFLCLHMEGCAGRLDFYTYGDSYADRDVVDIILTQYPLGDQAESVPTLCKAQYKFSFRFAELSE